MKSATSKRISALIIVFTIGLAVTVAISAAVSGHYLIKESTSKVESMTATEAGMINDWFNKYINFIESVDSDMLYMRDLSEDEMQRSFARHLNSNSDFLDVYMGLPDGRIISGDGWIPDYTQWQATAREWYTGAISDPSAVYMTAPYLDAETHKFCISFSKAAVADDGTVLGVFACDLLLDNLQAEVNQIAIAKGGGAFIASAGGDIYVDQSESNNPTVNTAGDTVFLNMSNISDYAKLSGMSGGSGDYLKLKGSDGSTNYYMMSVVQAAGWKLYTSVPSGFVTAGLRSLLIIIIPIAAAFLIIALVISIFVMRRIVNPIRALSGKLREISAGNLKTSLATNARDEIGGLSRDMMKVVDIFTRLVTDVRGIHKKHEVEGMTDARLDAASYDGEYAEAVNAINSALEYHISSKNEALGCITGIVNGDFNAPIRKFPGTEARINESVEGLRSSIKKVVAEIGSVAGRASAGELDYAVDLSSHKGGWVTLMQELNGIMTAVGRPLSELVTVINAMERGDFTKRAEGEFKGDFLIAENALNATVNSVSSYITDINDSLSRLASGDMTGAIEREYTGQFASIKTSINSIANTLNQTMREIVSASEQVLAGSRQVSQSSMALAQGATEQAESIRRLTEVVSDIDGKTNDNAKNSKQAASLADTSKRNAETGNDEMSRLLAAMENITKASQKINNIIKTIEGIASQTNLLALNAAIESAKAGEHGKGFGVVAGEVRNLASKSREAARESSVLIQESIDSVNEGMDRANETADSLSKIVQNAGDVSEVINMIYEASAQQTAAIAQVGEGLAQISDVVQSNSATSEESAAASEELSSQAETLQQMMAFFKTK